MTDPIKAAAARIEELASTLAISRDSPDAGHIEEILREHLKPRTCDSCRHWKEVCKPEEPEPLGVCRHCAINHWQPGYTYDPSKIWEDDEDPYWGVGTGPKFGCVHWEASE